MDCDSLPESSTTDTNKLKEIQNMNGVASSDAVPSVIPNGIEEQKEKKHKENKHKDHKHKHRDDKHKSKHSSSSSKDKHRDKSESKDKVKSEHKDKDRSKSEHRHKDKHKSSSKDKDRHSSSSKDKDKKREKDRHKDGDKEKHKDRHKDGEKDKHKEKHRDKDSIKHKDSDKRKSDEKRKDGDKQSDSKHKDKHREKDKHRHKDGEKREHKDKHRDKDRHKDKHRDKSHKHRDKDKHREKKDELKKELLEEKPEIKKEPDIDYVDGDSELGLSKSSTSIVENETIIKYEDEDSSMVKEEDDTMEDDTIKDEDDTIKDEDTTADDSMDDDNRLVIKEEASDEEQPEEEYNASQSAEEEEEEEAEWEEPDDEDDEDFEEKPKKKSKKKRSAEKSEDEDWMDEDEDFKPKKKVKSESRRKRKAPESDEDDFSPATKKSRKEQKNKKIKKEKGGKVKQEKESPKKEVSSPTKGRKKKEEEQQDVWRWWEEDRSDGKVKWRTLEHKGPIFAPDYEPLPSNVKFYYNGEEFKLSEPAEEAASFYAKMLDNDYTNKPVFNDNFFTDWRKFMTAEEQSKIRKLSKCDFTKMHAYYKMKSEENKNKTKEEKKELKEKNLALMNEYGFCILDGHKQKIGNFKIEPPGLFRGRGEHPKMGKIKKRVQPEDVTINCSQDAKVPDPPKGHKWKEIRHDNTVTWLASWVENVQGQPKYVMLNANSRLKGEKDWQKYETARKLKKSVDKIRDDYRRDWKSKEMRLRQRAVALYFIDKLALRAGNEKDSDETADTVGCCSLRVEHITLHDDKDGKECVVEFDFLGKDSIRYYNAVPVEKRVFKNLHLFVENKKGEDDLFDRLNTTTLNKYLNELMEGLTAKVFRTYNASITLQEQLNKLTDEDDNVPAKVLSYNRANRAVAILCNHQRAVPKTYAKSMENLQNKINDKQGQIEEQEAEYREAKKAHDHKAADKAKKKLERLKDQMNKLQTQATDREENKEIALGTSKLNYLDPRISVAWCRKFEVPVEKVYNKTQREKFQWAIDMAGADYVF